MGNPYPYASVNGTVLGMDDWSQYRLWQVTYTSRQGRVNQGVWWAASGDEAIAQMQAFLPLQQLFGPVSNVSAVPTDQQGDT